MIRIATSLIALAAISTAALAQDAEFKGDCTAFKEAGKAACDATQWCRWIDRKPVSTPDGKQFTPAGYCAFKAGLKQAWADKAKPQQ